MVLYMIFLCCLLKTEALLLFSPKYIGMFLAGCIILCIPYLEKGMRWEDVKTIFRKNAIMAGYLETFMLIYVSMIQNRILLETLMAELALDIRPLFYGFVCYVILKEESRTQIQEDKKKPMDEDRDAEAGAEKREKKRELDFSKLTRAEKQVAELARRGLTNREIGEELFISEATVKKHMSNIFDKLEIDSRRELR
ncbi:MAG: hypothetical protein HDQ97_09430 [Lachnospiraceae bacterium]|nr:hypothetical protein [Lachnospiraceae bacterium]